MLFRIYCKLLLEVRRHHVGGDINNMISQDEIIQFIREMGLKVTPQRLELIKIILENIKTHPSFNNLVTLAKNKLPTVSVSTVYNTVTLLIKNGIINKFEYNGETRCDNRHPHINVIYEDTREIQDINDPKIIKLIEKKLNNEYKVKTIVVYATPR